METPLYSTLNSATGFRDKNAIPTLGPYAYLLYQCISHPPEDNDEVMKKMATEKGKDRRVKETQWITLYRGLGLPEDAIKTYQELSEKTGLDAEFGFTAFTSTSINKKTAMEFAF